MAEEAIMAHKTRNLEAVILISYHIFLGDNFFLGTIAFSISLLRHTGLVREKVREDDEGD